MESMGETINRLAKMDMRDGLRNFTVYIDITKDDIRAGKPEDCGECPAALALERALPAATYIAVAGSYAKVNVDAVTYKSKSEALLDFVMKFDSRQYVEPQRIRLNFVEYV